MQIDVHEHGGKWYLSTGWKDASDYPLKAKKGSKDETQRHGRFGYRFHWSVSEATWIERLYQDATAFPTQAAAKSFLSDHRITLESVTPITASSGEMKTVQT
jgi:hypothetical protein